MVEVGDGARRIFEVPRAGRSCTCPGHAARPPSPRPAAGQPGHRGPHALRPFARGEAGRGSALRATSATSSLERPPSMRSPPLAFEQLRERRRRAAGEVAGTRIQQNRSTTAQRFALETLDNGAAGDRLVREQIRGAQQHAYLRAALGERSGQRRHHRRGARVVDSAGKQYVAGRQVGWEEARSSIVSTAAFHRAKLPRGPTWPPHSRPSKTNRRVPVSMNSFSRPGEGTCR